MTSQPSRVVFDCNVYFQALISPLGPAAKCLLAAARGQVILFCSEPSIDEFRNVAGRLKLRTKFHTTDEQVERIIDTIRECAILVAEIPDVYQHPSDPDDSHYVNLAVACSAKLLVSRDGDLLRLMNTQLVEGRDFRTRFPNIEIITPDLLVRDLDIAKE